MKPKNIQSVIRFTLLTCFFAALLLLPAALFAQTANAMLAFTSGGHALGFRADAMFAASRDHALRVEFVNANAVSPQANDAVARNDSTRGAPGLTRVTYPNLWNGVTLAYDAPAGEIARSTYTLAPFADPAQIRLRYNAPLAVNADGELSIAFETGAMRETAPIAWQDIGGARVPVQIAFRVVGAREVGFAVGDYDRAYSLQIDPTLTWNTFLGSSGYDKGYSVAVDANGNVYVAGYSTATWGSPVRAFSSGGDAFAAKLDSSGALTWNTFLGGSGSDYGNSVAVDANGNVYVAGYSYVTWGSPARAFSGFNDAFAAKLDFSGVLTWNTFLGGGGNDIGYSVAVDANGNVYVAGGSDATWGSPVRAFSSYNDAFVVKLGSACALKPAKPTLGLPAKNGSVTKPKVKLKWNDVSCETEYRVTVKNVATNQTVFQSTLGADVTQVKTTKLAKGQTYKWFVQACNDIGCTKSATWKFFIKP